MLDGKFNELWNLKKKKNRISFPKQTRKSEPHYQRVIITQICILLPM